MFSWQNYQTLKAASTCTFVRNDDNHFTVHCKQFDPMTGNALPDEETPVLLSDLQSQRKVLSDQVAQLDQLITDLQAVPAPAEVTPAATTTTTPPSTQPV